MRKPKNTPAAKLARSRWNKVAPAERKRISDEMIAAKKRAEKARIRAAVKRALARERAA